MTRARKAWARISMNQMGGYYRIDEYDPITDSVKVEHISFTDYEEAKTYCRNVARAAEEVK